MRNFLKLSLIFINRHFALRIKIVHFRPRDGQVLYYNDGIMLGCVPGYH